MPRSSSSCEARRAADDLEVSGGRSCRTHVVLHVPGLTPHRRGVRGPSRASSTFARRQSSRPAPPHRRSGARRARGSRIHVAVYCHIAGTTARPRPSSRTRPSPHLYRIEDGRVAEIWFHNRDQAAVDAFWREPQPPLTRSSAPSGAWGRPGLEPALGEVDGARAVRVAAGGSQRVRGESASGRARRAPRRGRRGSPPGWPASADLAPDRVAGEVPAGVLAERLHPAALAAPARPAARRGRASRRRPARAAAAGCTGRPAKASTRSRNSHGRPRHPRPDHHAVAPRLGHHRERVVRPPRCRRCRARGSA